MSSQKNDLDREEQELIAHVHLPQCPEVELLYAAREGVLPEEQSARVAEHLSHCGVCTTLFEDLEAIAFGMPTAGDSASIRERIERGAPGAFERANRSGASHRHWWIPALAVAACALLAFLFFRPVKSIPPASAPQIAQAKPLPQIPLKKLPIRVDVSALLATRGAATEPSGPELVKALARYQKDDFSGAAQQLTALSQKYPQDETVRLYLGVSELFLNRDEDAAKELAEATKRSEGPPLADSQWYLSVALLRLNNPTEALPILSTLCEGKSSYSERACTIESQLK